MPHVKPLERVRAGMREEGIDFLLVRSTDPYLNEYVPPEDAQRAWLTGFTGSMGEALVGHTEAWLVVDGRYWDQAEAQSGADWTIVKAEGSGSIDGHLRGVLARVGGSGVVIGYPSDRVTPGTLQSLAKGVAGSWKPLSKDRVGAAWEASGQRPAPNPPSVRAVAEASLGGDVASRLDAVFSSLPDDIDGWLVQPLDDIAWLTGLRGEGLPYQATFRARAVATRDEVRLNTEAQVPAQAGVRPVAFDALVSPGARIGYDPARCTEALLTGVTEAGAVLVPLPDPVARVKSIKTEAELSCMRVALKKADRVLLEVIQGINARVASGDRVSEADVAAEVQARFMAHGARGLSFRVIAGAGENSAIIHYGTPSPTRLLKPGELMLIDNGGYFEEGYATDMTRTFLVGGPDVQASPLQRHRFTAVLRGAIAGMRAVLPRGVTGAQLDGIVRAPIWEAGGDYAHGTGHGVGINVHEFPPRISGAATAPLEPGQVFSIEPGWYEPGWGGIRIENLCTLVPNAERDGFLQVEPLTRCPLDHRLIDFGALREDERAWLQRFEAGADA